ncbi:MAG: DUF1761 domain-containing protein [Nitrosomonadales bacterium]|nr:DUF1761 domain-containing protein [Nitrosomonadales bacterium]
MVAVIFELNWWAVLLATFGYFILGAIWFTPLFGKYYDIALGFDRRKDFKWPAIYYISPFVNSLVVSIATATLAHLLKIEQLADAVTLGLIAGIGYAGAISFNNAVNPVTPRPLLYGAVTGGYHVTGITLVALVILYLR